MYESLKSDYYTDLLRRRVTESWALLITPEVNLKSLPGLFISETGAPLALRVSVSDL